MDEKIQNSNNFFTMNFINENSNENNENLITEFETQKNSTESNNEKNFFQFSNENFKIDDDVYKIKKKQPGRKKKTTKKKKIHSRKENGNIRSKIKNIFFNFIIKFLNEKIKIHTKLKVKFRKISL